MAKYNQTKWRQTWTVVVDDESLRRAIKPGSVCNIAFTDVAIDALTVLLTVARVRHQGVVIRALREIKLHGIKCIQMKLITFVVMAFTVNIESFNAIIVSRKGSTAILDLKSQAGAAPQVNLQARDPPWV